MPFILISIADFETFCESSLSDLVEETLFGRRKKRDGLHAIYTGV